MSLSKEKLTLLGAAAEVPRQPKCTRCRHHGIVVPQKGHMKLCPFLKCACRRCFLITERTRITALQRNLRRAEELRKNEKRAAAPEAWNASSHLSDVTRAPESVVTIARSPVDLLCGPAAGGERVAGSDPTGAHSFGELRPSALLPFIHFPLRMSAHYPSHFHFHNVPWLTPVPAALYDRGLQGPLLFPHYQQSAVHFPPPPEHGPPANHKQIFFTLQPPPLPEAFQEEQVSKQNPQPPLAKHADPDIVELD